MVLMNNQTANREEGMLYAQTVQKGLLPKIRHFDKVFNNHFVIYKPQDKIGGDFYWLTTKENVVYFAMADCTGHGVSGAMLSVLGISLLNYVIQKKVDHIGDYLTELDKKWIETFNNEFNDTHFNNDWLEIVLVSYNLKTHEFNYATAGGEFAIYQNDEIKIHKGNNYPIGGWQIEKNRTFNSYKITLDKDAKLYFFTDGIKHQFNDTNNKKFSRKKLIDLLLSSSNLSMPNQKNHINVLFDLWKGNTPQTDDISLVGIELKTMLR